MRHHPATGTDSPLLTFYFILYAHVFGATNLLSLLLSMCSKSCPLYVLTEQKSLLSKIMSFSKETVLILFPLKAQDAPSFEVFMVWIWF